MYIVIDRFTTKTCVQLLRGFCSDREVVVGEVYIHVYTKACPTECRRKQVWTGCQWEWTDEIIEAKHIIRYDALEVAPDGSVCFLWDNQFLGQECGQYTGDIYVCGELSATVTFVLTNHMSVGGAVNVRVPNCNGC